MKATVFVLAAFAPMVLTQSTLCGQYDHFSANGYDFNNNNWGKGSATSGSQCTYVQSTSTSGVGWRTTWAWAGGQDKVKSYAYSGRQIEKKPVSQYKSLQTKTQWSYNNTNIRANVAYDLFTAADVNHDTSSGDYELMVWLGKFGDISPIGKSQGQVNVAGTNWELFYGPNGQMQVYSFVAPNAMTSFNSNLKDFFDYLTKNKAFPASTQNLITYQFGTEPFTGDKTTLSVTQWSAEAS
ncbi:glycoside hydrolase family 12 protein [Periconia macrospinosa]|uniref:Glycoside hydrolase family 12 protein n=1 Tax=Periconia macrospinosa TaxID=97972 RepID=A0A2V1DVC7_9PLEO|nr:glycoside hydrolase family 12 protein [Periconia macrospinosa]